MEEQTKPVARKTTNLPLAAVGVGVMALLGLGILWSFYDLVTTDSSAQLTACFDFASSPVGRLFHAVTGK